MLMYCMTLFAAAGQVQESNSSSNAKMFSLTPEEMLFASKLSDSNRRKFCYKFSLKERSLAMLSEEVALSPDERVEKIFASFYGQFESKDQVR